MPTAEQLKARIAKRHEVENHAYADCCRGIDRRNSYASASALYYAYARKWDEVSEMFAQIDEEAYNQGV